MKKIINIILLGILLILFSNSASAIQETESNDSKLLSDIINFNTSVTGQISSINDQDWFKIKTSGALTMSVNYSYDEINPAYILILWNITVMDSSNNILSSTNITSLENSTDISIGIAGAGNYYIKIVPVDDSSYADNFRNYPYTLMATTTVTDPNSVETELNDSDFFADPLTSQVTLTGQVSSLNDQDWFYMRTTGPNTISINFTHPEINTIYSIIPWNITVLDSYGNILAGSNIGASINSTDLTVGISEAGKYYIKITSEDDSSYADPYRNYPYSLTATKTNANPDSIETELNDSKFYADPLTSQEPITGQISSLNDQDWFYIRTTDADTISINFTHPGIDTTTSYILWKITVLDSWENTLSSYNITSTVNSNDFNVTVSSAGKYYLKITPVDDTIFSAPYRNISYNITVSISDPLPAPPIIDYFSAEPVSGNAPLNVSFECVAHDSDGNITEYRWDFDGDQSVDRVTTTGITDYTYNNPGNYSPVCIVVDNDSLETSSFAINITIEESLTITDTDNDGVPDVWDQCSNTPIGSTVYANGCPAVKGDLDDNKILRLDDCIGILQILSGIRNK